MLESKDFNSNDNISSGKTTQKAQKQRKENEMKLLSIDDPNILKNNIDNYDAELALAKLSDKDKIIETDLGKKIFNTDLSKAITRDEIVIVENCVTSLNGTFLRNKENFYCCPNHKEKDFLVCEVCAEECHSLDIDKIKKYVKKGVFTCMCADNQHKKCTNILKDNNKDKGYNCQCNNLYPEFTSKYFVLKWEFTKDDEDNYDDEDKEDSSETRRCLFCFLALIKFNMKYSEVSFEKAVKDALIRLVSMEELKDTPKETLCLCNSDHHAFGTDFCDAANVSLFFISIIFCAKEPEALASYGIDFKQLVSFMYNENKNKTFKTVIDKYFTNQMDNQKEEEIGQDSLTFDILLFAQFFSSLIENYQMSETANPFVEVLTVSEMTSIFEPVKVKFLFKEMNLKMSALAIFYNFSFLPKTFITSRSVFKNDLNFSPFHRNYFLSDISKLLETLDGEDAFFYLLDNISKFLYEESFIADQYVDRSVEKTFIPTIFYFLQILKNFQYYKIKNISILKKLVEYIKNILVTFNNLNDKNVIEIEEDDDGEEEELEEAEEGDKQIDKDKEKEKEKEEDDDAIIPVEQSKTNQIIKKLNNQTYKSRLEAIKRALEYLNNEFEFSSYLMDEFISSYSPYPAKWIIQDVTRISKMILVKYNDIIIERLIETNCLTTENSFCFTKNDLSRDLILSLFNPDNKSFKIEDIDILDMLIHEDDCYILNLNYINKSKFNVHFKLEKIMYTPPFFDPNLGKCRDDMKKYLNSYLFNELPKKEYEKILKEVLTQYRSFLQAAFNLELEGDVFKIAKSKGVTKEKVINKQIKLAEQGYFFELLEILMTLIRLGLIKSSYISELFTCIEFFTIDNPFLGIIVFSEEVYQTILTVNDIDFYKIGLFFYFKITYLVFIYSYKIDLSSFFLTFHKNIIETDDLITEFKVNNIINLLLKQILKIRLPKDFSNPMSRILQILDNFRKKFNLTDLLRELFIDDSIPCIFVGPINGKNI